MLIAILLAGVYLGGVFVSLGENWVRRDNGLSADAIAESLAWPVGVALLIAIGRNKARDVLGLSEPIFSEPEPCPRCGTELCGIVCESCQWPRLGHTYSSSSIDDLAALLNAEREAARAEVDCWAARFCAEHDAANQFARERDEARAAYASASREWAERHEHARERIAGLTEERDEARAEADEVVAEGMEQIGRLRDERDDARALATRMHRRAQEAERLVGLAMRIGYATCWPLRSERDHFMGLWRKLDAELAWRAARQMAEERRQTDE